MEEFAEVCLKRVYRGYFDYSLNFQCLSQISYRSRNKDFWLVTSSSHKQHDLNEVNRVIWYYQQS